MTDTTAPEDLDISNIDLSAKLSHTLLEIWSKVLNSVDAVAAERVSPAVANKIVGSWPKLSYQDVPAYHAGYHALLGVLRDDLNELIDEHPGCFKNVGEDEDSDAIANRDIYVELMFRWNARFLEWEHEWDAAAPLSHVQLAAIGDAQAFTTGSMGLIQHLGQPQVGFSWSDDDQQALAARLEAHLEGLKGGEGE